jgi:hypothetical protein
MAANTLCPRFCKNSRRLVELGRDVTADDVVLKEDYAYPKAGPGIKVLAAHRPPLAHIITRLARLAQRRKNQINGQLSACLADARLCRAAEWWIGACRAAEWWIGATG